MANQFVAEAFGSWDSPYTSYLVSWIGSVYAVYGKPFVHGDGLWMEVSMGGPAVLVGVCEYMQAVSHIPTPINILNHHG